jgi:hypothetical protein
MQDPASEFRRIILPRTPVNKGKKKGWGLYEPLRLVYGTALTLRRPSHRLAPDVTVLRHSRLGKEQLIKVLQKRVKFHVYLPIEQCLRLHPYLMRSMHRRT